VLILLWGLGSERPLALVHEELQRLGAPVMLIDERELSRVELQILVGSRIRGCLRIGDERRDLEAVTALYIRPYDFSSVPDIAAAGPLSPEWAHAAAIEESLWSWAEMTPALVVSRPSDMAANGSKPFQLQQIRASGFRVPETLVTTDPVAAQAFWERHRRVIYKSTSSVRSIVSCLKPDDAVRLADVRYCPTQFQEYVAGTDHRVNVVGSEVFAAEVISDATDYRYPGESNVAIRACTLPPEIEQRCLSMARAMRLPVAGIDLRRTPDGEWCCFEVNPSPAYTYYQSATDQPISGAIARLLMAGDPAA